MYDYFFTFRSVTAAMKGSQVLEAGGLRGMLFRTPKSLQRQGCGYSLRIKEENVSRVRLLFSREEVRYQKIYRKTAGDEWQEVAL